MGKWESTRPLQRLQRHEHEGPVIAAFTHKTVPGEGSVWRCSCGKGWKVVRGVYSLGCSDFKPWKVFGEEYYLKFYNYGVIKNV